MVLRTRKATNNFGWRARGYITADVRNQTEYGTVRAYIAVGVNSNDFGLTYGTAAGALAFSSNRTFVQWAGMTAGVSQSFYDFYSVPAVQYRGGYLPASDTGDPGWMVWAYTAQFGGGFSGTISAEARRSTQIIDNSGAALTATTGTVLPGAFTSSTVGGAASVAPVAGAYGGEQMPDIVANLRVDQSWGGAQIMGALHEVNPLYYTSGVPGSGHPSDSYGWAAGAGLKLNTPFISQGDWFQAQANVTQGALRYLFFTAGTGNYGAADGAGEGWGVISDCVYGGVGATATGCNLTSAWGVNASYDHFWTPALHTDLYGAYYVVKYSGSANNMLCSVEAAGAGVGTGALAAAGCNNNWSTWGIGSRTQWDVTKTFYLGVEVLYQGIQSATLPGNTLTAPLTIAGTGATTVANEHNWMVGVRAHRDFLP
jgi:hypothetical protein